MNDRKARKAQKNRELIMNAAVSIIGEKGFKSATTKEIAARADMAEGTLYNYFKNKDDILMSIAERYVTTKRNFKISGDYTSVMDFLINLYKPDVEGDIETIKKDRQVLKALMPEFLSNKTLGQMYLTRIVNPYLEAIEGNLKLLKEKNKVKDFDVKAVSRILYGAFIGFAMLDIHKDPVVSGATPEFRKEVEKAYLEVFSKGLLPD